MIRVSRVPHSCELEPGVAAGDQHPRRAFLARTLGLLTLAPLSTLGRTLGYPRLMQGPMLGELGPTYFTVWARASGALPLQVEYSAREDFSSPQLSSAAATSARADFTAVLRIEGLQPATRYFYRVLVDGVIDRYRPMPYSLMTAPQSAADFRVAFGSCARIALDPDQRIFDGVRRVEPQLFFWLGDNIYADTESPQAIAEEYQRQRSVERLQPLLQTVPQLAIWDDHDFGYNNGDGTSPFKRESLEVFRRYWANPAYGMAEAPGVFFSYRYGGIDFFFLDGRFHRDPNNASDGPSKSFLGFLQKQWLKNELLRSRAPFKLLVCGSGWSKADGPQGDTWAAFLTERDELFEFIRERNISGVVCLSGDSHVGELNCVPWSQRGGYDFYDLVSSPLAQPPADTWVKQQPEIRIRKVYSKGANFGLLEFNHAPEPVLRFTLRNATGASVWEPLVLKAAELRNGIESWRSKIDRAELERQGL